MANTCSLDDMLDGSTCLDHFADNEKLAASVYYLCAGLSACSSQDCTLDGLQTSAQCLKELSLEKLSSIAAYADKLEAIAAGASFDGTEDELQAGIKCLRGLSEVELKAMQVYLRCALRACL